MQFWPMANQLGCFGIPKFNVSILASSQEQTGMRDCGYFGDTSFTQIIHLKLDSKTKSPYVSLFFIKKKLPYLNEPLACTTASRLDSALPIGDRLLSACQY